MTELYELVQQTWIWDSGQSASSLGFIMALSVIPHSELIGPSELFRSCHHDRPLNQRLMLM